MFDGTGSQTATSNRWGDYSPMSVDPVGDCTFCYTQEYYATNSSFNWRTRIGNFKFGTCGATTGENIVLSSRQRVKNGKNQVQLTWSPAENDGNIDVMRNGVVLRSVPDNGKFNDSLGAMTGTFTYQVCETDGGGCSNTINVTFP